MTRQSTIHIVIIPKQSNPRMIMFIDELVHIFQKKCIIWVIWAADQDFTNTGSVTD